MKLSFKPEIVFKMSASTIPKPDTWPLGWDDYDPEFDSLHANYLVYDSHNASPSGFAVRVGKKAWVFVDKTAKGKKLKVLTVCCSR